MLTQTGIVVAVPDEGMLCTFGLCMQNDTPRPGLPLLSTQAPTSHSSAALTQGCIVVAVPDEAGDEGVLAIVSTAPQLQVGGQVVQQGNVLGSPQRGAEVAQQHREGLALLGVDAVALQAPSVAE